MKNPDVISSRKTADAAVTTASGLPEHWPDILKARAHELAQESAAEALTERIEVVTFTLAYETYAIETVHVREVYPLKDLTPLPCTPAFVAGIVNVRGQIVSVIDIKQFFDLPANGLTDLNKVIILSDGDLVFGILADTIVDVRHIPLQTIQPSLPTLTGIREDYLKGVTKERLVILDAAKLLADARIVVHEDVE
ncbi:MAG: chemotaxis protein CheW [Methylomonas sp.]|jgi:purine-binding chemotaxis protein CheW|uniref:chemotaxis protein CheW n=1 Tax=Methylomonas sp. TaxID=418 RepID=UPI0025EE0E96|nr:chemotaxis protein CheW [Methylomonas sp.]MCK9607487.1 chemotaxis protein CheW [Methylomonas sp.]